MVLRNGIRVSRYIYSDIDKVAQQVASYRMAQFSAAYPELFPLEAWQQALSTLSADAWQVYAEQQLPRLAAAWSGQQWLVVAGWECQDLSPAGSNKGLHGSKSSTYFALTVMLQALQTS
jgi:site-specific DNA-cytosine methylase